MRNNFNSYITDIVSKNGGDGGGSKKEKSREAIENRASQAIEGAKKYLQQIEEQEKEEKYNAKRFVVEDSDKVSI